MGFTTDPNAYDVVLLGGLLVPGEVHLDVMRELATQAQRGSGDDGAEPRFRGLKPCEFTLSLKLHTDEDEAAWAKLAPRIFDMNRPTNRNQLSVVHPQLQRMGISRCVVIGIGEKKPMNGDPIEATIKCHSAKRRSDSTHKPKPKTDAKPQLLSGSLSGDLYLGEGPDVLFAGPAAAALKDRNYTPVQQARLDNGIPKSTVDKVRDQITPPEQLFGMR